MYMCESFRAGHTYAQVAPYAKQVNNICTPMFCQYGTFNTGKTTLLSALSALHGIQNGKVQRKYHLQNFLQRGGSNKWFSTKKEKKTDFG